MSADYLLKSHEARIQELESFRGDFQGEILSSVAELKTMVGGISMDTIDIKHRLSKIEETVQKAHRSDVKRDSRIQSLEEDKTERKAHIKAVLGWTAGIVGTVLAVVIVAWLGLGG